MDFLLTRPEADTEKLARHLTALGHRVYGEPLLEISYLTSDKVEQDNYQAMLFTSANGVRAWVRQSENRTIACYCVGDATAREAREAGFRAVHVAGGNVDRLAELVIDDLDPEAGPLLHISGKDIAGNLAGELEKTGFQITRRQLYSAVKRPSLSPETQALIRAGQISHMPFYSPRTAKTFIELVQKAGLGQDLVYITALCLSSAVADVIRSHSWRGILTAAQPDQPRLFELIDVTLEENRQ